MVVPVFGHRKYEEDDDPAERPIAIIQLINKSNLKNIDQYDIDRVNAMRDLLGHSIENASEYHSVINARVGIEESLDALVPKFAPGGSIETAQREKQQIMDALPDVFAPIKESCAAMHERHEDAKAAGLIQKY